MKRLTLVAQLLGAVLTSLLATRPACAQFVGDVFFTQPSIVVPQYGSAALELSIFSGAKPFGATGVTMDFNPDQLQVVSVEPVAGAPLRLTLQWSVKNGVLRLMAVNGASLAEPLGTVPLAKIVLKALAPVGTQVTVATSVFEAHAADLTALRAGQGYGAEINVGAAASAGPSGSRKAVAAGGVDGESLVRRASRMRPPGHRVQLYVPVGDGLYAPVEVPTAVQSGNRE